MAGEATLTALALVPEQLSGYVLAVGQGEFALLGGLPAYRSGKSLVIVAFPTALDLAADDWRGRLARDCLQTLDTAGRDRSFRSLTLLSAVPLDWPAPGWSLEERRQDSYCFLHLQAASPVPAAWARPAVQNCHPGSGRAEQSREGQDSAGLAATGSSLQDLPVPVSAKLRNLLRRADRELLVTRASWDADCAAMAEFYRARNVLPAGTRHIFGRVSQYLESVPEAFLFLARRPQDGRLEGLAVADFSSLATAMYQFAFRRLDAVPGTADRLLAAIVVEAAQRGCERLNLGLDISGGIAFFKRKWGALPFLDYHEATWTRKSTLARLLGRMSGR